MKLPYRFYSTCTDKQNVKFYVLYVRSWKSSHESHSWLNGNRYFNLFHKAKGSRPLNSSYRRPNWTYLQAPDKWPVMNDLVSSICTDFFMSSYKFYILPLTTELMNVHPKLLRSSILSYTFLHSARLQHRVYISRRGCVQESSESCPGSELSLGRSRDLEVRGHIIAIRSPAPDTAAGLEIEVQTRVHWRGRPWKWPETIRAQGYNAVKDNQNRTET